jgi:tetratricopeptide (TPR) repeat protein
MRVIVLGAIVIAFSHPSYPQFLPDLQAKTPEEYDAYLDVLDGPVLEKGAAFARNFPESSLRLPVYELLARAWRAKGDAGRALQSASAGLAIAPDYIPLLVELADLIANGAGDLDRADAAANRALKLLETAKAPRRIRPEEWLPAVASLRARAHGARALVLFKRDDSAGAVKEFEEALKADSTESPMLHYRIGRLYASMGRVAQARIHLEQAAQRGEGQLRELANGALAELR